MNFPNAKDLKKLADACRKAGISHFKQGDLEFTLTSETPVSTYKKAQKANLLSPETKVDAIDNNFQSDELTEDQLLFWSAPSNDEMSEDTSQ